MESLDQWEVLNFIEPSKEQLKLIKTVEKTIQFDPNDYGPHRCVFHYAIGNVGIIPLNARKATETFPAIICDIPCGYGGPWLQVKPSKRTDTYTLGPISGCMLYVYDALQKMDDQYRAERKGLMYLKKRVIDECISIYRRVGGSLALPKLSFMYEEDKT